MRKFLSCGLIAALAILPTALKVCAEPPPAEPTPISVSTGSTVAADCSNGCSPSKK